MRPDRRSSLVDTAPDDRVHRSHGLAEAVSRSGWHSAAHSSTRTVPAAGNVRVKDGTVGHGVVPCQSGVETFLYVANFGDGTVDVFDCHRRQVSSFCDPSLPRSYAPLDLQIIDGSLFVTFVDRDVFCRDPFAEPEHGVIAEFNPDGVLLDRAEFRTRCRYGVAWRRQMRERVASEHVRRKQARRTSRRSQPAS